MKIKASFLYFFSVVIIAEKSVKKRDIRTFLISHTYM